MTMKKLGFTLILIFLGAAVGLVLIYESVEPNGLNEIQKSIFSEASKSLLQLMALIVIGGAVTALYKAFENSKNETKLRTEIRMDYLKRVGTAYRDAKNTRRVLRAAGITTKYKNPPITLDGAQQAVYQKEMQTLNNSQLEFEALKIEAASLPELLGLQGMFSLLQSMEEYLRNITKEYERFWASQIPNGKAIQFDKLDRLVEFTGSSDKANPDGFEQRLATPHDKVIGLISTNTTLQTKP